MKQVLLFICAIIFIQTAKSQTSYTWNGSVSTAANNAANWSPNGIPSPTDYATIVAASNICVLNTNASITNFTITSGTLDLGGNTLTVIGSNAIFTSGTVQNGTLTVSGATTTTFGSGTVTMNCVVNVISATVTFKNTTFQKAVNITKTGTSNDASSGNNIFNGPATITNAGSGHLSLGNGSADQFNNTSTFNNTGSDYLFIANNSSNNIFGGLVTFNNTPTANTYILVSWYSAGTIFNNNIAVASNNGQGVQFCGGNGSASATLAPGNTISAGPGGFSAGTLLLNQFTQSGATPQNITLSGSAIMNFSGATFNGSLTVNSPNIYTSNSIYNGTTILTKTDGTSNNSSAGGNSFNGMLTVNYNSSNGNGYWAFGNGTPDIYNGDVYSNNNSLDRIIFGINSTNNQFNGNLIVTQTGSAAGTTTSWNVGSTSVMASGKSVSIGGAGFTSGYLALQGFTQNGNAAINLTTTGTSSIYIGGYSANNPSVIGGSLTLTSPDIYMRGGTFNAPVSLTKTGGSYNHNNGYQNVFNSTLAINQQSNGGYFMLGYNSNDLFNDNITLTSTGSGGIYLGWTSGTGTPTLAAGKTILVGGAGFNSGFLSLNTFTQLGNTPMNLTFTGANTSLSFANNSVIGGNLVTITPDILFSGCTFNGTVGATKTGGATDRGNGGNIFQGASTFTNSGSGYLMFGNGNPDQFNAASTFNNTGSDNIYVAYNSSNNVFGGIATFNNNPTANTMIYVGMYSAGTIFNNNIIVTSNNGQGVQFCSGNGSAAASLSAGKTISVGTGGFTSGTLLLRQFTQAGATPQILTLTGSSILTFGPNSAFGGDITTSSPTLYFNGCNFSGTLNSTKTGATNDASSGNNVFNAASVFTNNGSGYLMFGNGNADQFNAASTFNNSGSGNLYVAYNSSNNIFGGIATFNNTPTANSYISVSQYAVGTIFNSNIVVTSTNGQGIQFCNGNTSATATLAAGNTILVGAGGFSAGNLLLKQFSQVGATAQNIIMTGAGNLTYGPSSSFGGDVTSASSGLYLNGCNFSGATNLTKNGASGDYSLGANTFNGVCSITNSGSSFLVLGNTNPDTWNNDVTFTDNGSERLLPCWASAGNEFNGNIFVNTSGSATGIEFCGSNTTATATLAASKAIQSGSTGLNAGYLILKQFTQLGNAAVNLSLSSTATYLQFGPNTTIGGNVISSSPGLYFNGCTFNGTVNSTKTGSTSDASSGNNVFNGASTFTNAGSGYLMFGNGNSDQFNAASTFNNTGSSNIYVAYNSSNNAFGGVATFNNIPTSNTRIYISWNSAGTVFNNNIVVTSSNGQGVQFCGGNGSASATLAAGKTISVGTGGFSAGTLLLQQFTQLGSSPQNLALTGSGNLIFGPISTFGGNVTTSSPALSFNGCTFSGIVNSTKTGTTNDQSQGNNIFNEASTFTNNGTGYLLMTLNSPDAYNSDVTFVKSNSGLIYPNYNNNSTYSGNVTVSSSTAITFGASSGTATFNGAGLQNINAASGTPTPVFTSLVINNSGSGVTLNNTPINVSNNLVLNSGLLNTTTTNILTMLNGSTVASGDATSTSYVNGPMRYQKSGSGVSTLNFPIGNSPDCRPVVLTVNHSNGTLYTYEAQLYDASAAALGYTLPPTVDVVSHIHYYTIKRTDASGNSQPVAGLSGNQTIQIFFGSNDVVVDGGTLTIVKNTYTSPTSWIDIGGTGGPAYAYGSNLLGSITSTSSPSAFNSFSTFALADDLGGLNPLPIQVVNFNALLENNNTVDLTWTTKTEINNDYFTIEKSSDAVNFEFFQNISTEALNGNSAIPLSYEVHDANPYNGTTYYRLKQTDLNGKVTYWNVVSVTLNKSQSVSVYPNPTTDAIFISGLNANENNLKIVWYDISGRLLAQNQVSVMGGVAKIDVRLSDGVYILSYTSSDGIIHQQRVIVRK